MREVTDGRAFDVIIESEYRNILDADARDIYGAVCAVSRTKSTARDGLIAGSKNLQLQDLYSSVHQLLEGIVVEEVIDESRQLDGLRARHQIIADIVWNRCLNDMQRETILLSIMDSLNLTFGTDIKTFEALTRDEFAIDGMRSFESRVRFFERACRKDPKNVYVRQHFARMLRREGKHEMALAQIEQAIGMAPGKRVRMMHHTKGVILSDLATGSDSLEVGRRYLGQSEQAFDAALAIDDRDEYSYQSLADLYLDWAKRVDTETERATYLAKAQETLAEGLEKGRELEHLYMMEARIEEYIGNTPGQLEALERALESSPASIHVRYLLGNALRVAGKPLESAEILGAGMQQEPSDPRLAYSYVKTLLTNGESISRCCSVLSLAKTRGLRDPAYVAAYSGLLKLNGEVALGEQLLSEANRRNFSATDIRRVMFIPGKFTTLPDLIGIVTRVTPGYAFVNVPNRGDFFFPGSRIKSRALDVGSMLCFVAGFTVRGGVVHRVIDREPDDLTLEGVS